VEHAAVVDHEDVAGEESDASGGRLQPRERAPESHERLARLGRPADGFEPRCVEEAIAVGSPREDRRRGRRVPEAHHRGQLEKLEVTACVCVERHDDVTTIDEQGGPIALVLRAAPPRDQVGLRMIGVQRDRIGTSQVRPLPGDDTHRRIVNDLPEIRRERDELVLLVRPVEPNKPLLTELPCEVLAHGVPQSLHACQQRFEQSCQQFAAPPSSLGICST